MKQTPHLILKQDWLTPLYKRANQIVVDNTDIESEFWDDDGDKQIYYVKGPIDPHTDGEIGNSAGFPEYSYLLILHCGSNVYLLQEDRSTLKLEKGMLLLLRSWREHSLIQTRRQKLVWHCIDSNDKLPLEDIAMVMKEALCKSSTPLVPA